MPLKATFIVGALVAFACGSSAATEDDGGGGGPFYVCRAGLKDHTGTFKAKGKQDGVHKYVNEKDITMFRHNGYWYIGDMKPWPPVTNYRCVADCDKDEDVPPTVAFETNPMKGKDPAPTVQTEPCDKDEL